METISGQQGLEVVTAPENGIRDSKTVPPRTIPSQSVDALNGHLTQNVRHLMIGCAGCYSATAGRASEAPSPCGHTTAVDHEHAAGKGASILLGDPGWPRM